MQELKEEFRKIYETSENPTEGMLSISEWLAKSSSVFTKSCQTIRNWFGEIISYFERVFLSQQRFPIHPVPLLQELFLGHRRLAKFKHRFYPINYGRMMNSL
ncbi:hypothetical protein MAESPC_00686 [Microcystis aeruginosa SPC777]|uniref:Transposase IS204/IS1001/IS1096/IS1165 DDE domain-containing protein n=1 Tax=Microcystis aeruginosa SPC777 TaxID=482300 RepID=S3KHS1_MICAE|nr:hypothetical protein MAESPC_00686 [Microcystis aeruginosa SPC777]